MYALTNCKKIILEYKCSQLLQKNEIIKPAVHAITKQQNNIDCGLWHREENLEEIPASLGKRPLK